MASFEFPVRVRYHEVDAQGVVFNAWYLAWFDEAMTEFLESRGLTYRAMLDAGYDVQLVHTELDWRGALLALVLARGEDAVWFVAGLLRPCLPTVTRLRVPSLRSPAPAPWGGLPRSVTVLGGVGRRGPPVRRALP